MVSWFGANARSGHPFIGQNAQIVFEQMAKVGKPLHKILMALLASSPAFAQPDVTGTWQADVESGGRLWVWTLDLIQSGSLVTGTVEQQIDDVAEIAEGQVLDGVLEFKVDIPTHRVIRFTGEVDDDEISFHREVEVREGGDPGGFGVYGQRALSDFTVRRIQNGQQRKRPRGGPLPRRLTMLDRDGHVVRTIGDTGDYRWPALSTDNTRLAAVRPDTRAPRVLSPLDPGTSSAMRDVWVFDLSGSDGRIVASAPDLQTPIWSPDGKQIAYFSYREGHGEIHRRSSDGTGSEELLLHLPLGVADVALDGYSADGRAIFFTLGATLQSLPLDGAEQPVELLREAYSAYGVGVSSDSRLVAYLSNEGSGTGVYIRAFDPESMALSAESLLVGKVSDSWSRPSYTDRRIHWRRNSELYYQHEEGELMAVTVSAGPPIRAETPRPLFDPPSTGMRQWADSLMTVSQDGRLFVFSVPVFPERVEVAPALLARYVGAYRLEPEGTEFVITLKSDELWSERSDDPGNSLPMIPRSEQSFHSQRFGEEIDFVTDESGAATHLVVYNNGVGRRAFRK